VISKQRPLPTLLHSCIYKPTVIIPKNIMLASKTMAIVTLAKPCVNENIYRVKQKKGCVPKKVKRGTLILKKVH